MSEVDTVYYTFVDIGALVPLRTLLHDSTIRVKEATISVNTTGMSLGLADHKDLPSTTTPVAYLTQLISFLEFRGSPGLPLFVRLLRIAFAVRRLSTDCISHLRIEERLNPHVCLEDTD